MKIKVYESTPENNRYYSETELIYGSYDEEAEGNIINIIDDIAYQEILGFGGAFTEAAAYNYSLLDEKQKKDFIEKYFDRKKGIGYNFGRTHINSCDFALDVYSYVENGDSTLETFQIDRDKKYVIPFLKDALAVCKEEVVLFSSPWSPPAYMKSSESAIGGGKLLEDYKKTWALYYAKYIKAYREEGIQISAITVQNEPKAVQTWESCVWTAKEERDFIVNDLAPTLEAEGLGDVKIIIWDHNKERVYERAADILTDRTANEKVWAVGHHWYSGDHFEGLSLIQERFHKPNICTEFCAESHLAEPIETAERYAKSICGNLNHYMIASCDWNMLLDENGGPFHDRTGGGCYAPVFYDSEKKKLIYTPTYYYIGHFSRFIERGAKCIAFTKYTDLLYVCAFRNLNGSIVSVIMNTTEKDMPIVLRHKKSNTFYDVKAHSIVTVVMEEACEQKGGL